MSFSTSSPTPHRSGLELQRRTLLFSAVAALCTGCASGAVAEAGGGAGSEADALVKQFLGATGLADCSVAVMRGETTLYERYMGAYGPRTQVPIASASKWMVGATIMSLVDEGRLRLEAPVSTYLPELPPAYGALRLDQLMSYTAGLPGLRDFIELRQPANISLLESAMMAARAPLVAAPGVRFDYGGPNLQFVGAAAERVSGMSWHELFRQRISRPLGMTSTLWGRVRQAPDPAAPVRNPVLQGGAWTTLGDHAAFLTMIAQSGTYRGAKVLSPGAIAAMDRIMTMGLQKGAAMPGEGPGKAEYMIAHWCERIGEDGLCDLSSSPGAFGAYPWIDRRADIHGLILVQDQRPRIAASQMVLRNGLTRLFGVQGAR